MKSFKSLKILLICEYYAPSVGGVQEVMRQIGERLVQRGHRVTVATSHLAERNFQELNGVHIQEFAVSGNLVRGLTGEIENFQNFVVSGSWDVLMIKAAQQWSFDALWPVLERIKAGKCLIPCGFSGLYDPAYAQYFQRLPAILKQFDHLIFYASDYRDIQLARQHGISHFSVIPNGASREEFSVSPDPQFRQRLGIAADELLLLTVGSFTGLKGHLELALAYELAEVPGRSTLILNGNQLPAPPPPATWKGKLKRTLRGQLQKLGLGLDYGQKLAQTVARIRKCRPQKRVLLTNLPRPQVVQAFMAADLFVFASLIEYSPLVLFEAAAAGTPVLTVPVGNAAEIVGWTQGGEVCPAPVDQQGYTRVSPPILADHISRLAHDRNHLRVLGSRGKEQWVTRFTWDQIVQEYERLFWEIKTR